MKITTSSQEGFIICSGDSFVRRPLWEGRRIYSCEMTKDLKYAKVWKSPSAVRDALSAVQQYLGYLGIARTKETPSITNYTLTTFRIQSISIILVMNTDD